MSTSRTFRRGSIGMIGQDVDGSNRRGDQLREDVEVIEAILASRESENIRTSPLNRRIFGDFIFLGCEWSGMIVDLTTLRQT
jgi:hypothetical protein